jgi:hypothetical protein
LVNEFVYVVDIVGVQLFVLVLTIKVNVALDVDDELIVGVIVFVLVLIDVLLTVAVIVDVFDTEDDPDIVDEI